jgi:hypothetical protein
MVAAADARRVNPLRKEEKKHGIKRRPQTVDAERLPGVPLDRAVGALVTTVAGCSTAAVGQITC